MATSDNASNEAASKNESKAQKVRRIEELTRVVIRMAQSDPLDPEMVSTLQKLASRHLDIGDSKTALCIRMKVLEIIVADGQGPTHPMMLNARNEAKIAATAAKAHDKTGPKRVNKQQQNWIKKNKNVLRSTRWKSTDAKKVAKVVIWLQRAVVSFRMKDFVGAEKKCTQILKVGIPDAIKMKVLHCRAQARHELRRHEDSKEDLVAALGLVPGDEKCEKLFAKVKASIDKVRQEREKRQELSTLTTVNRL